MTLSISPLKHCRVHILLLTVLLLCTCCAGQLLGQWKKLFDFSYPVITVDFKEFPNKPLDGFVSVGINSPGDRSKALWRTTDGGLTWHNVTFEDNNKGGFTTPYSFTFKNEFEGWFSSFLTDTYIYGTVDGGETWSRITVGAFNINSLHYVPLTNRLIITGGSFLYSDDGITFNNVNIPGSDPTIGIAFSDDRHGIISAGKIDPPPTKSLFTSDGGITWYQTNQQGEQYQPIGIAGTQTFYAIAEDDGTNSGKAGTLIKSMDGGATWNEIYQHHDNRDFFGVTGTLQYNDKGIFYQTVEDNSEGIMMSDDSGKTFFSICGPPNNSDTRFYVRDSFIYSGDKYGGLWLNTTGIGSNSKPILSKDTLKLISTNCSSVSNILTFTLFDSCNGRQAELVSTSLSASNNFTIVSGDNPRRIHPNDSITISYKSSNISDTGLLHLKFKLGWKEFDTVVSLVGIYQPPQSAFIPLVSDTALSLMSFVCYGKEQTIYYSLFDSCISTKGELVSATVTGSTNFLVTADDDSATVIYNGAGYDTAKLALKFRLYEYEYDTVITLYGYPSATKDSLSFLATLTKPSVTVEETTELRVAPDKAAVDKNLSEIRFDVTLDADVLEPLTNFTSEIPEVISVRMDPGVAVGKLTRYRFIIQGNNMTLDPTQNILRLTMRPYVSDTTMTTIEVSSFTLNGFDPDYERCTLSATGDGTPFTLELMCGDSLLSRHLGGKPILTVISLKPNPTKSDVTVTFDLAMSGMVRAEVLDVLGNVVKQETLEARQGRTKYDIKLSDAAEGVYYVRLRFAGETRTVKFVRE